MELTRFDRAEAYWMRQGWAPRGPIKTETRIDVPKGGPKVPMGPVVVGGVAWAQNRGVRAVEVLVDDGGWQPAAQGASYSNQTWRLWSFPWRVKSPGKHGPRRKFVLFRDGCQAGSGMRVVVATKNRRSASAIRARTGAPEMTTSTIVTDWWVWPRARTCSVGTPAAWSAAA